MAAPEYLSDEEFLTTRPLSKTASWHWAALDAVRRWGLGEPLLDAGCNCGYFLARLIGAGFRDVSGVDLDPAAAHKAGLLTEHGGHRVDVRVADITVCLPFDDCSFETVVCTEVLEHLPDPSSAVDELWRVLRLGGRLLVSTPVAGRGGTHLEPHCDSPSGVAAKDRHFHWSEMTAADLQALFTRPGLRVLAHTFFGLKGEGTLRSKGLHLPYRIARRTPLVRRFGRNQLLLVEKTSS